MKTKEAETPRIEAVKESIVKKYISDNYSGDDLGDEEMVCLGRLLGVVERCNRLYALTQQAADGIAAGMSAYTRLRAEYDRLMSIGLMSAAAVAAEPIPKIVADIQAHRRQLKGPAEELDKVKADFIKCPGIDQMQEQYRQAAAAFDRQRQRMAFIERTADYCARQVDMILSTCNQMSKEAESNITIPHFNDLPEIG